MTRSKYLNEEDARKANNERSIIRHRKLYTEDPDYKKNYVEKARLRYSKIKNQFLEITNLKAQLQAYQNPQPMLID